MTNNAGIPSNLYMGGVTNFNVQPFVNYYMQTQQRQQAQDNAMIKYFGDMGKNLTPAGMHSNDIPGLMDRKNQWQQFNMQNRRAVARPYLDGGKAYQQSMGMYNDMQGYIQQSKDKVNNIKEIAPIIRDPTKRALLTGSTLDDLQSGELPIDHPNYKPIDLTQLNYNPKPFGIPEQQRLTSTLAHIKGDESVDNISQDKVNNKTIVKYKNTFSPNQLNSMYNMGASLYHNNPGFKQTIDQEADPTGTTYSTMNDMFNQHYGRDIATPEDMAAAHILQMNPNREGRQVVSNTVANPISLINARAKSAENVFDYEQNRRDAKQSQSGNNVDDLVNNMFQDAKKTPVTYTPSGGTPVTQYETKATPETLKMFQYKDPDTKQFVQPDHLRLSQDGKYVQPIFLQKGEAGAASASGNIAVDADHSKPVLVDEFKARLRKELAGTKANEKPITTPAPKDPLGIR